MNRRSQAQARRVVVPSLGFGAFLAVTYVLLWLLDDKSTPSSLTSTYLRFAPFWVSPLIALACQRRGWTARSASGLSMVIFIAFFLLATVIQHGDLSLRRAIVAVVLGAFSAIPVPLFLRSFNKQPSPAANPPQDAAYGGA